MLQFYRRKYINNPKEGGYEETMKKVIMFASIGFILLFICIIGLSILAHNNDNIIKAVEIEPQGNLIAEENTNPIITGELKPEPEEDKRTTILILGTDQRKNEIARSDTMIVAQYLHNEKKAYLVSIPRDGKITLKDKGMQKINAAYAYGGADWAVETVEELLDIKLDGYIFTNFKGFKEITEALGGVSVNNKKPIKWTDGEQGKTYVIPAGEQRLKGDELLMYVRFRGDSEGDFGRIKRQQEVIQSVIQEMLNLKNIFKIPKIAQAVQNNTKTDLNLGEFLNLAWQVKDIGNIEIESFTLKTTSEKINGIWYENIDTEDLKRISDILNGVSSITDNEEKVEENNSFSFE